MELSKTFTIPNEVSKEAKLGLELRKEYSRGGTNVGWNRARDLQNRKPLSLPIIAMMWLYFRRHEVDKKGKNFNNPNRPSNGKIAWLLWGGDSGYRWATDIKKNIDSEIWKRAVSKAFQIMKNR